MIVEKIILAIRSSLITGLVLGAFTAAGVAPAHAQNAIKVLVNDEPITSYDIAQRAKMLRAFTGGKAGEKQAIDQLIEEKLMMQEAKRRNVSIPDSDVDQEIGRRAQGAKLTPAQFSQAMRQAGFDPQSFRDFVRANITWSKIVRARFQATVDITDQDVAAALTGKDTTAAQQQLATEYMLQPVLFIVPPGSAKSVEAERMRQAATFRAGFQGCDHAVEQAAALPGVVVKPIVRREESKIPPPLRKSLEAVEIGGTTAPERVSDGLQVLAVCAKNQIAGETEAAVSAREELSGERGQLLARRYLRDLRSDAVIEYR